jgi:phosphoribosylformylglycinamidine synthase subunit PurL
MVAEGLLHGVHDVADGGLALALAEMAARGGTGFRVSGVADHVALFGESPSRVIVCCDPQAVDEVVGRAESAGVAVRRLGEAGGDRAVVEGLLDVDLAAIVTRYERALPEAFEVAATH